MIFSFLSKKNLLMIFLYSLFFGEDEYLARFSFFNTVYLLLRAFLTQYFGEFATVPFQFLGVGVTGAFIFLVPEPIIRVYSFMIFVVGNIYTNHDIAKVY